MEKYTEQRKKMRYGPQQKRGRITMEARWRCRIIEITDKVDGEENGGRSLWRRFRTTGMDMVVDKLYDGNR